MRICKRISALLIGLSLLVSVSVSPAAAAETETVTGVSGWTVITLDPGHGGEDSGAYVKVNGVTVYERDLNLKIAQYVKSYLETYAHTKVYLTRSDNASRPGLGERVETGAENGSDAVISLHLNALDSSNKISGSEVLVTNGLYTSATDAPYSPYSSTLAPAEYALGASILKSLNSELGLSILGKDSLGLIKRSATEDKWPNGQAADYYGIVRGGIKYGVPSIIVENCFLDDPDDYANYLSSDAKLKALAKADADGIAAYFNLTQKTAANANDVCNITDYHHSWAVDYIDKAILAGWMQGYPDSTFRADTVLTRGMFVTVLCRMAGVDTSGYASAASSFSDVASSSWYAAAVAWASDKGIVTGYDDGLFRPGTEITREQMASIMSRYLRVMQSCDTTPTQAGLDALDALSDGASVSDWARSDVAFCLGAGLLNGMGDGSFAPQANATRAQVCAVLLRLNDYGATASGGDSAPALAEAETGSASLSSAQEAGQTDIQSLWTQYGVQDAGALGSVPDEEP